jgi:nitroreductase
MNMNIPKTLPIVWVNRILVLVVMVLTLVTVYLWSERQGWLAPKQPLSVTSTNQVITNVPTATIKLPQVTDEFKVSLGQSLKNNLPKHAYLNEAIPEKSLGALLWAAQGIISPWGDRSTPSYKSMYPLKIIVMVRNVIGVPPGNYQYEAASHGLIPIPTQTIGMNHLPNEPTSLEAAPIVVGIAIDAKIQAGLDPVELALDSPYEAGMVAENLYLAANNLGYGTVTILKIDPKWPAAVGLDPNEPLLILMPIGIANEAQAGAMTPELNQEVVNKK